MGIRDVTYHLYELLMIDCELFGHVEHGELLVLEHVERGEGHLRVRLALVRLRVEAVNRIDHGIGAPHPRHHTRHRLDLNIVLTRLCRYFFYIGFIVHCDEFHSSVHVAAVAICSMYPVYLVECHTHISAIFKGVLVSITNHIDAFVPATLELSYLLWI